MLKFVILPDNLWCRFDRIVDDVVIFGEDRLYPQRLQQT